MQQRQCYQGNGVVEAACPQAHNSWARGCASGHARLYTIAPARADTRLYMLCAVDIDDFALIRPIFRAVHEARANWIFADVFPFLRVAFIVSQ